MDWLVTMWRRYFIAQDAEEVKRVTLYCKACHEQVSCTVGNST